MKVTLKIWRQKNRKDAGKFVSYPVDIENAKCRCWSARRAQRRADRKGRRAGGLRARLPRRHLRLLRLHDQRRRARPNARHHRLPVTMRHFKDGEELVIEPWRAAAFPLIKDLVVDRRSFDRIIAAGGYISVSTGNAPDGNTHPHRQRDG